MKLLILADLSDSVASHAPDANVMLIIARVLLCLLGLYLYFIPAMVARHSRKTNFGAILALNFFLGWTLIGWVAALVWALTRDAAAVIHDELAATQSGRR